MVLKFNYYTSIKKLKRIITLPLLLGFIFGLLTYYLLLNYGNKKLTSVKINQENNQIDNKELYHQLDLTKRSINHNTSLLCLIFINDIDSLLMQQNVWGKKCGKNIVYMSKHKHNYLNHVVTETYSTHSWKYYCQTLIYLHKNYMMYDWIFLAKDNVWLIYENLIHFISLINMKKHKYNYYAGQYVNDILTSNAGLLLSSNTLSALVKFLNIMDGCNTETIDNKSEILDFYLKKLNNTIPIANLDSYGCTLFHSQSLYDLFNVTNIMPNKLNKCISKSAITFQLDITTNYAIFYKYILYKVRLITNQDFVQSNNIILPPSLDDNNIWRIEGFYELNIDPQNMTQLEFFNFWLKLREIIL